MKKIIKRFGKAIVTLAVGPMIIAAGVLESTFSLYKVIVDVILGRGIGKD